MDAREKELIRKANDELMQKRKALGINPRQSEPISKQISLTYDLDQDEVKQYFLVLENGDLPADHPRIDLTSRQRWDEFNSDRHPDLQRAVKLISEWYMERRHHGYGLILAGGYGVGKTHLAQAIRDLCAPNTAKFWNEQKLCDELQGSYGHYARRSQESIFLEAWQADLLIYDGLGEYETHNVAWMQNIYYKLFSNRLENRKGFMITTNLDCVLDNNKSSEFRSWVGNKNFSRIFGAVEDTRFCVDLFDVPDYRLRKFA